MILICDIDPFKYDQSIFLVQDNGDIVDNIGKMKMVSLYSFIPSYCHKNNISTVKLTGNKEYNEMVRNQIKYNEETLFADYEPINVEVI